MKHDVKLKCRYFIPPTSTKNDDLRSVAKSVIVDDGSTDAVTRHDILDVRIDVDCERLVCLDDETVLFFNIVLLLLAANALFLLPTTEN